VNNLLDCSSFELYDVLKEKLGNNIDKVLLDFVDYLLVREGGYLFATHQS
jgi:hypothetical protein